MSLAVWALVAVSTGTSLWWLWLSVPPGLALVVLYLAGIGRPRRG